MTTLPGIAIIRHQDWGDYALAPNDQEAAKCTVPAITVAELRKLYEATGGAQLQPEMVRAILETKRILGGKIESAKSIGLGDRDDGARSIGQAGTAVHRQGLESNPGQRPLKETDRK